MNIQRIPALALAIALQVFPVCRVAILNQTIAPSEFAFVLRWFAAATATLGAFHAVSGASAAIAGVANNSPPGPVTLSATGKVGSTFSYRIIVTNPGPSNDQDYFDAAPLPAGLTINTNLGGNGFITGTPTVSGSYPVTLSAGNGYFRLGSQLRIVTKAITITVQGAGGSPPLITSPPTDLTVTSGGNATFSVVATGTAPLSYQWKLNGTNLVGATLSSLVVSNVTAANAGDYTVDVSNAAGTATSPPAHLTVQVTPLVTLLLSAPRWANGAFTFDVTGPAQTNLVIWASTNLAAWTPIQTNFTADGTLHFTNSSPSGRTLFYRASLSP